MKRDFKMKIIIKTRHGDVEAELNDTETAKNLYEMLPIKSETNLWGSEIYFKTPLKMKLEEPKKQEITAVKDKIIEMVKDAETEEGIDTEKLIMELHAQPEIINQEIRRLLEEGIIYEPRPGRLRYLG